MLARWRRTSSTKPSGVNRGAMTVRAPVARHARRKIPGAECASGQTIKCTSLAGGANADALKAVTHGRSQEILDLYTTMPWPTLCDAVRCLKVAFPLEAKHPSLPNRNGEPKSVGERDVEVVPAEEQQGACYALVTATEGNGEDHEKSQKAAALLASQDWRGVRDSNPWPPA